jgi:hypothetical protein
MSHANVIVWDIETVPDLRAAARMLNMEHAADEEVRAALGDGFPKHPLHKIVCIGALVAERQMAGWEVRALGAPHIRTFMDRVGELRPRLITFNRLWLVYELFRGTITTEQLAHSEAQVAEFIGTRKADNPHLLSAIASISEA